MVNLTLKKRFSSYKRDRFALVLSLYGAGAFEVVILSPTVVDPFLHHQTYGTRTYPLGIGVSVFSVAVFILLYLSNVTEAELFRFSSHSKAINRGCLSFISLFVCMLMVLPNFLPELPNNWVFSNSVIYGAFLGFFSFLRNYEPNYDFVKDITIDVKARIEMIHSISNTFYIALALFVTISAAAISFHTTALPSFITDPGEQYILWMVTSINSLYMLLGLFWGMVYRIFSLMTEAQQKYREIEPQKSQ